MAQGDRLFKALLSHPLTWVAVATVMALEGAFMTWFRPSLTMTAAALALGALSLGLWPLLCLRSPALTERLYRLPKELALEQQAKLQALARDFQELEFEQGAAQLRLLKQKFDNLAEVLKRRLNAGEMTYGRYFAMAEQVYLSALDNLHEAAVALRSVSTIDPDYIQARLQELRKTRAPSSDQDQEFTALRNRSTLFDEQRQRVDRLIAQNEAAMTVLDKTSTALAETKTDKAHAAMDAESAMAELELLAKRVSKYATTR